MKYFAYGSNMSLARLSQRTPNVERLGLFILIEHQLQFHKAGDDGSGKCDAAFTGNNQDKIYGALYEIDPKEKSTLDVIEGLGNGYNEKIVSVEGANGEKVKALTYYATDISDTLPPYTWYLDHVLIGAKEIGVPAHYLDGIKATYSVKDDDEKRLLKESVIYS